MPIILPLLAVQQTAGTVTIGDPAVSAAVDADGRPSVALSPTSTPPVVDGNLDDPVWKSAARINHFTQHRPVEGAPATEDTEVFIAYDSRHLYFAVYAHY